MVVEYFMDWVRTASVKKREAAAGALVRAYLNPMVEKDERDDLEAAITILSEDSAPTVRLVIAEGFGAFSSAPRHIMSSLAADNAEISIVVVSQSPVFHDSELISYFRTGNIQIQAAVSCRVWISQEVTDVICSEGCIEAVFGTLENPAARFTEENLHQIAARFGEETRIRANLLKQDKLASRTRHLLIGKLGDALGNYVLKKSWLTKERAQLAVGEACDRASIIFAAGAREEDISSVVQNLISHNRLTVAFLVRAICMGNITLVACAMSELSGVRFARVEAILTRNRESAFRAVYDRAGLPSSAFIVFKTAISTWRSLLSSDSKINKARLPFIVTREVLESYSDNPELLDHDLLVLLRRLSAETARENSRAQAEEIAARKRAKEEAAIAAAEAAARELAEEQQRNAEEQQRNEVAEGVADPQVVELIEAEFSDRCEGLVIHDVGSIPGRDVEGFADNDGALVDMSSGLLHAPSVKAA